MPDSLTRAVRWDTVVGALLVVVLLLSFTTVDGFGNALNLSFLIGNTLPIALIAMPMTLLVVALARSTCPWRPRPDCPAR